MNHVLRTRTMRDLAAQADAMTRALVRVLAIVSVGMLAGLLIPASSLAQSGPPATASLIVKLAAGLSADDVAAVVARNGGVRRSTVAALRLHVIEVQAEQRDELLARYRADPQVVRAEVNVARKSEALPSDPLYPGQWALPKINWDLVFGTQSPAAAVVVAVLDTGIDATHPDLGSNVIPGTSILDGSNGMTDPSGHGTRVAGIVAARTNTVPAAGIAGIGYAGVRLMPVTVLDAQGLGKDSDIIAGVVWAADHDADVILMAFSNPDFSESLQEAIDYAWSKDVLLVAAVGNEGVNSSSFPAGDRGVIGVAATDANDQLASFSNYGASAFLAAPGTDILTTDLVGAYSTMSGTSSSAAIVAGAAAQLWALDPTLTNGIIVGRLARSADPAGTQSQTGNGRINLARALLDTGTEFIQPAGSAPVGSGGPFVGPYRAAATHLQSIAAGAQTPNPVNIGASATYPITINFNGNGSCTVTLSVSGLPSGATGTYSPSSITGTSTNPPRTSTLTVTTTASSVPGSTTFTVRVTGTGGSGNDCSTAETQQASAALVIGKAATSIVASSATGTYGGTVNLSATLTAGASGLGGKTVSFTLNGSPVGTATTNAAGVATLPNASLGALNVGTYASGVGAAFAGDSSFNASNGAASLTVSAAETTTSVSAPTITYNANGSVTVTVNSAAGTPTGNVSLTVDGGGAITQALSAGSTTFTLTSPNAGDHALNASFSAQGNFAASSATGTLHVNAASTTTSVSAPTITYNANGSVTVTVNSAAGTPSGNVSLTVDGGASITQALSAGSTTFMLASPNAGDHALNASFSAQGNFAASSATGTLHVNAASTTTSITAPTITYNANGSVTVSVTSSAGTPSGNVSLTVDGGASITQALSAGSTTFVLASPNAGDHALSASFAAQGNFAASSTTGTLHVDKAGTSTSIATSGSPSATGASVTFTATVAPAMAGGSVEFFDGATSLGTGTLSAGVATLSTTTLSVGTHSITATYAGDGNHLGSTSVAVTQVVDTPPSSLADAYAVLKDDELTVDVPGVLANDRDADEGQTLTAQLAVAPASGNLTLNGDGSFSYTPAAGFTGVVSFTYHATDGLLAGADRTVTITVLDPAATPVAQNDAYANIGGTLGVAAPGVLDNDNGQGLMAELATGPAHATTFTLNPDGSFTYVPETGFTGVDSFFYRAKNASSTTSNLAMVTISVLAPGSTVAANDAFTTDEDISLSVPALGVLANDGGATSSTRVSGPLYGVLALVPDGGFVYTPDSGFSGKDSFTYRASSGNGYTNLALATILVRTKTTTTISAPAVTYGMDGVVTVTVSAASGTPSGDVSLGIDGGAAVTKTLDATGKAVFTFPGLKAGPHPLSASYAAQGTFSGSAATGELQVNRKLASVTPEAKNKTYGSPDPMLTGVLAGFLATDNVVATYSRTAGETVAGSPYTISATLSPTSVLDNYDITYNTADFTINRKDASVTPAAKSKIYGEADPPLTGTLAGFLAADNVVPSYSRTAGESVAGSPYTISATLGPAGVLDNYNITYNTANFTIGRRPITVTADAKTKVYGDADPALTYKITSGSLAFSDTLTGALSRVAGETVGSYGITQGTLTASNDYTLVFVAADLLITPRPITVTADAKGKFLSNPPLADPPLTFRITSGSLAFSDGFTGALARVAGESAGAYPITQGTLALSSNYTLTYVPANLTIIDVSVSGPVGPLAKGTPATVTASFLNTGTQAGPKCKFEWDDTTTTDNVAPPAVPVVGTNWTCSATRTYAAAGVYSVKVTVKDANTGETAVFFQYVVIYDANGGFVTGGGWINSPAGAYTADTNLTGKANFGFVSKYKQGQSVPTGETEFQFKAGNFNFHSSLYEWLVIAGSKAQYKGSGTVNGAGDYGFLLTATDGKINNGGGIDKFRIKIWNKATSTIVYDNKMGASDDIDSAEPQALGGGSITIHK